MWRHPMETFSALLALCEGNHQSPVDTPHKGQWRGALVFSLIYGGKFMSILPDNNASVLTNIEWG